MRGKSGKKISNHAESSMHAPTTHTLRAQDASTVEEETLERVNRAIISIESFLLKWDAAKTKPDDLFPHVVRVRHFHDALRNWQKVSVTATKTNTKSRKKSKDDKTKAKTNEAAARRLRNFVLICREYS